MSGYAIRNFHVSFADFFGQEKTIGADILQVLIHQLNIVILF